MKVSKSITGYNDYLYEHMKKSFNQAKKVDIIVSFLMESGVKLIVEELKLLKKRQIPIRILTGNYLNITQPSALYLIKDLLGDSVDLRFFNDPNRSFHAKSYFFEYDNGKEMYIGSSNLSKSAWTNGVEWNFKITQKEHPEDYNYYYQTFEDLFYNHSIIITDSELDFYSKNWKKNKIHQTIPLVVNENIEASEPITSNYVELFEPRGAQIEALYHLKKTREDGFKKGLVVAATGIGKTYLAAFDSREFKRVLFVAHRDEILKQAGRSFKNVRHLNEVGYFNANQKDTQKDIIFASVQSLGKKEVLDSGIFEPDSFDYIVIDEFHHAVAKNYQNIIEFFTPKFLLGLTATPYRLDNKDVLALCDYNVVYEAPLKKAINQGWLVPFRYYGIYDETVDYTAIPINNGKYQNKSLEEALSIHRRGQLILDNYLKYNSKQAMGFCSSKTHADFMSEFFNEHGIKACAVYSGANGKYTLDRSTAISKLIKGDMQVIFSIDMFNEGLDIPSIDTIMLLRPTESPTIFLQQLGRGLRKHSQKNYLNVLDFIGNYKKANLTPFLLIGEPLRNGAGCSKLIQREELFPEDCIIDFDFRIIDLFKELDNTSQKKKEIILKIFNRDNKKPLMVNQLVIDEYYEIKQDLGHRPSRVEFFTYLSDDLYLDMKKNNNSNIFKDYLSFLLKLGELSEEENSWYSSIGGDFIWMIENTSMSKTYKLPTFLAFIKDGKLKMKISDDDLYDSFMKFYNQGTNGVDLKNAKSTQNFKSWGKNKYVNLARKNPVFYLCSTASNFFSSDDNFVYLNNDLSFLENNQSFIHHMKDAINFRRHEYYKNRLNLTM